MFSKHAMEAPGGGAPRARLEPPQALCRRSPHPGDSPGDHLGSAGTVLGKSRTSFSRWLSPVFASPGSRFQPPACPRQALQVSRSQAAGPGQGTALARKGGDTPACDCVDTARALFCMPAPPVPLPPALAASPSSPRQPTCRGTATSPTARPLLPKRAQALPSQAPRHSTQRACAPSWLPGPGVKERAAAAVYQELQQRERVLWTPTEGGLAPCRLPSLSQGVALKLSDGAQLSIAVAGAWCVGERKSCAGRGARGGRAGPGAGGPSRPYPGPRAVAGGV